MPIWRFVVIGVCSLVFRRIPAVIAFYKLIPEVSGIGEAVFLGYFGPVAVGALFYLQICVQYLESFDAPDNAYIIQMVRPIVYFTMLTSILVHGLSIPILRLMIKQRDYIKKSLTLQSDASFVVRINKRLNSKPPEAEAFEVGATRIVEVTGEIDERV